MELFIILHLLNDRGFVYGYYLKLWISATQNTYPVIRHEKQTIRTQR